MATAPSPTAVWARIDNDYTTRFAGRRGAAHVARLTPTTVTQIATPDDLVAALRGHHGPVVARIVFAHVRTACDGGDPAAFALLAKAAVGGLRRLATMHANASGESVEEAAQIVWAGLHHAACSTAARNPSATILWLLVDVRRQLWAARRHQRRYRRTGDVTSVGGYDLARVTDPVAHVDLDDATTGFERIVATTATALKQAVITKHHAHLMVLTAAGHSSVDIAAMTDMAERTVRRHLADAIARTAQIAA
jgi:DNA-directed RNA polymerase specialized sigma24 family protein